MKTTKFKKVLVANRGEIAIRVMRTCREMGIQTVAVYSEADEKALHRYFADESYLIGPAPANESYLVIEKIIEVAKASGADAIHPGYGFLSEKAELSQACLDAGIILIGPKPSAISSMGNKLEARDVAEKANVPIVPGTKEPISDLDVVKEIALDMGYPVLLKAAAGGGGKGMRVVYEEKDLQSSYEMAASEAKKAFGDDRVFVEKYIEKPRHVEIQVIRDEHGQGFFLGERECSLQRRHQKVIEETPCVYLKDDVRQAMAAASLRLADAVDYHGVGTVEYLVDAEQDFYFLEMNTRLQVEHTVTEMVFGLDLVRLQIHVAQGEKLDLNQDDLVSRGHAIQCRVYAEDPQNGFLPSPGKIQVFQTPEGLGVRHDSAVKAGSEISIYYDPMIAKLIVHAGSRDEALQKMARALDEYQVTGLTHNIGFLKTLVALKDFHDLKCHTQYLDQNPELAKEQQDVVVPKEVLWAVAALSKRKCGPSNSQTQTQESVWEQTPSQWRLNGMREETNRRL